MMVAWTWVVSVNMKRGDGLTRKNMFLTITPTCLWENVKMINFRRQRHSCGYIGRELRREVWARDEYLRVIGIEKVDCLGCRWNCLFSLKTFCLEYQLCCWALHSIPGMVSGWGRRSSLLEWLLLHSCWSAPVCCPLVTLESSAPHARQLNPLCPGCFSWGLRTWQLYDSWNMWHRLQLPPQLLETFS